MVPLLLMILCFLLAAAASRAVQYYLEQVHRAGFLWQDTESHLIIGIMNSALTVFRK